MKKEATGCVRQLENRAPVCVWVKKRAATEEENNRPFQLDNLILRRQPNKPCNRQ